MTRRVTPLLARVAEMEHLPDDSLDSHPHTPWHETVIYELHVKGFTQQHPDVPEQVCAGRMPGLSSLAAIEHFRKLKASPRSSCCQCIITSTSICSSPATARTTGATTRSPLFAPDPRYAAGGARRARWQVNSARWCATLHAAESRSALIVVYNHTAEGRLEDGPTLSFRGIDNVAYYRLDTKRARYVDFTGCGNSLNVAHPRTLQLIMDSLRHWVTEMHVDGFRFDLASALARDSWEVDRLSSFFDIIQQDPVLSEVKLIAEPWDIGPNGYQVGNFPVLWSEWNGKYRDCVRRFWKGNGGTVGEMATRLAGSSDLYSHDDGWHPSAHINFITAHDGFAFEISSATTRNTS